MVQHQFLDLNPRRPSTMDPFMDVCSTENIEVATRTEILNITPDVALTTDDVVSFGRPTVHSNTVEIDEADLVDEDEIVQEEEVDEDKADDNVLVIFAGPRGGKNCPFKFNGRCYWLYLRQIYIEVQYHLLVMRQKKRVFPAMYG